MYKITITELEEIKESLIRTNEILRLESRKFHEIEGVYYPSKVNSQIEKNETIIANLEDKYFI